METANDFSDLKERLTERGYSGLPIGLIPMIHFEHEQKPMASTSSCRIITTMLRKK